MVHNNICRECRKLHAKKSVRCACGYYLVKEYLTNIETNKCEFVEKGVLCDQPAMHSIKANDNLCEVHKYELIDKNGNC